MKSPFGTTSPLVHVPSLIFHSGIVGLNVSVNVKVRDVPFSFVTTVMGQVCVCVLFCLFVHPSPIPLFLSVVEIQNVQRASFYDNVTSLHDPPGE